MSDEDFLSCVLRESDGGIRLGIGSNNVSLVFLTVSDGGNFFETIVTELSVVFSLRYFAIPLTAYMNGERRFSCISVTAFQTAFVLVYFL